MLYKPPGLIYRLFLKIHSFLTRKKDGERGPTPPSLFADFVYAVVVCTAAFFIFLHSIEWILYWLANLV